MPKVEGSTVWVLGAGFSRALGGPLIGNLLALRELKAIQQLHPESGVAQDIFKAQLFFRYGQQLGYWQDGEQFLDLVETAVEDGKKNSRFHGTALLEVMIKGSVRYPETVFPKDHANVAIFNSTGSAPRPGPLHEFSSVSALAVACRRALASDCCVFLRAANPRSERWNPYVSWIKALDSRDTILTFNYDRVPEILAEGASRVAIVHPFKAHAEVAQARADKKIPVLKLHGSVCWTLNTARGEINVDAGNEAALECAGSEDKMSLVAVPGPGKQAVSEFLKPVWEEALTALGSANCVFFLGYRFPPTDANARQKFLEALTERGSRTQIFTVLGPDTGTPDALRLQSLLRSTRPAGDLFPCAIPLYAEDFMSRYGAARLDVWRAG